MMRIHHMALLACTASLMAGCTSTYKRVGIESHKASQLEKQLVQRCAMMDREKEDKILALNPTNVTASDVVTLLSNCPAPRILNIHGGLDKVMPKMVSFSEFLIGMGYPGISITNAGDGTYTFSCYESSEMIAGCVAWYYEKEGMRPMMIGHSQGGMQAIKVLYKFANSDTNDLHVWNPLTWKEEERCTITDPLSGKVRPVAGLTVCYVSAVGSGGLTRLLVNQWDMIGRLHSVPDTTDAFTGFQKWNDMTGGDFMGYPALNLFKGSTNVCIRNVTLPTAYVHGDIPNTKHLLQDPKMRDWINNYRPVSTEPVLDAKFEGDSRHIFWAAEVWYDIKKYWVLELQKLIRAKRARTS